MEEEVGMSSFETGRKEESIFDNEMNLEVDTREMTLVISIFLKKGSLRVKGNWRRE